MSAPTKKNGYLYVLVHPDLPGYHKLGQTTKHPSQRLKEHNNQKARFIGKIVQRTGRPWQLLYYIPVTDPRRAESATLWYDVLPRWDNLELSSGDVRGAIEDIKRSPYLERQKYAEMITTELSSYDYERILRDLAHEWSRDGTAERCEALIEQLKTERNRTDRRRRQFPNGG